MLSLGEYSSLLRLFIDFNPGSSVFSQNRFGAPSTSVLLTYFVWRKYFLTVYHLPFNPVYGVLAMYRFNIFD